jgi:SAM-dependent methyltransferase
MKKVMSPLLYSTNEVEAKSARSQFNKILDVGCGYRKFPGALGIDQVRHAQVDLVVDLNKTPWPLEDNSFDLIVVQHTLEHVENIVRTMEEVYRVGKHGSRIVIQVPYFRSLDAYADPTHNHFFTAQTLDYFIQGTTLFKYHYSDAKFNLVGFWFGWPGEGRNYIRGLFKKFIRRFPKFYEYYLSILLPVKNLAWELEIDKMSS